MTVFKDVRKLATAAAKAAVAIVKGQKPPTTGTVKTKGRATEPAYLIPPQSITKANYKLLFTSRLPEEGRRLQRRVHEVLQVDAAVTTAEAALAGASVRILSYETRARERHPPPRAPRRLEVVRLRPGADRRRLRGARRAR